MAALNENSSDDRKHDFLGAFDTFESGAGKIGIYRLSRLEELGLGRVADLPFSIRVLLESVLRQCDGKIITEKHVKNLAGWQPRPTAGFDIPFKPARVILQDFTGVPAIVDLAAMRAAMKRLGGDPRRINPLVPVDLVIDHSVQVDHFASDDALQFNIDMEFQRNRERYEFLRWGQKAFDNFRVVPPETGIVHQVNLEFLGKCVLLGDRGGRPVAFPDTLVGTNSHTTMINGLGIVGWGVGGIEAEAAMLGQPLYMLTPEVIGFELVGRFSPGVTATDLVLTVAEMLRRHGVVGRFVEFFGSGLLAKKAVEKGLKSNPHVKTSLAPGSRVVTDYLDRAGLTPALKALGFHTVGYGCTTCIGNSGPLPNAVAKAVTEGSLVAAAVLSGNRNFEGRIHALVRASYLASPPLVVAFALAGRVDIDLTSEPLSVGTDGQPVYLREIWPSPEEVASLRDQTVLPEMFRERYSRVFEGNDRWNHLKLSGGALYEWDESSTYIQEPPFFIDLPPKPAPIAPIRGARALLLLGDSITTDHISPAGAIAKDGAAGRYLQECGVEPRDFNSYGSRRGNDRVMTRGTFANVRIRNRLAPGTEGGFTRHLPDGELMTVFDASVKYRGEGVPLVILAGAEYGSGSSRDWAAKGTNLLGVKAVIAAGYERIHRSNLVGMGVLPLEFQKGETWQSLGLTGEEVYDIDGLGDELQPGDQLTVRATAADGTRRELTVIARIESPVEVDYYRHGGILSAMLRSMLETT